MIRPFLYRVTIASSQVEVSGPFSSHTIPFSEIRGCRSKGSKGMYLYRRGKRQVFVRDSMLELDGYYEQWKASIYDLDKADRLRRKGAGKERLTDWFAGGNDEQQPVIGGPDVIT